MTNNKEIKIKGNYIDKDLIMNYICNVYLYKGKYYNGLGEIVDIKDGDILRPFSNWFALYQNINQ
jgi:hypothetical protein